VIAKCCVRITSTLAKRRRKTHGMGGALPEVLPRAVNGEFNDAPIGSIDFARPAWISMRALFLWRPDSALYAGQRRLPHCPGRSLLALGQIGLRTSFRRSDQLLRDALIGTGFFERFVPICDLLFKDRLFTLSEPATRSNLQNHQSAYAARLFHCLITEDPGAKECA